MTVRSANQIRPSHMPLYCSACSGQYPDRQYVDFDAECDRGYGDMQIQGPSQGEGSNAPAIQMDWLILCEDCLREGASIIGLVDAAELKGENAILRHRLEQEEAARKQAESYADGLEQALNNRPAKKGMSAENREAASYRMKKMHEEGKLRKKVA